MGRLLRMGPRRTVTTAMSCLFALQAAAVSAAPEGGARLRLAPDIAESPVGGHLAPITRPDLVNPLLTRILDARR